jgi:hypothetical protein
MHAKLKQENIKGRKNLEEQGIDGRVMLVKVGCGRELLDSNSP